MKCPNCGHVFKQVRKMAESDKLKHCSGCYNNEYNYGLGGAKKCWLLDSAKLTKRKKVGMNDVPPWTWKPQKFLSCYQQKGYVFINCDKEDRQR